MITVRIRGRVLVAGEVHHADWNDEGTRFTLICEPTDALSAANVTATSEAATAGALVLTCSRCRAAARRRLHGALRP